MKLSEVTQPQCSPDLKEYLMDLKILDRATLSPSGMLIVRGDVYIPVGAHSLKFPFESVGGDFDCSHTNITSLQGIPLHVGRSLYLSGSKITSLEGIHKTHRNWKIGKILYLPANCADIVGLALIEGINRVWINNITFDISDHDPHTFQEKLIDAGMRAQARM